MKTCTKCKIEKDLNCFYKSSSRKDKLQTCCKSCSKQFGKNYKKQYYENNKDYIIEKSRNWYENNKDRKREYDKQYCEINKDKLSESKKQWVEENKDHLLKYRKEYYRNRRKTDVNYRLKRSVSQAVRHMIKIKLSKKRGSILNNLSFSIQQLKQHLESQFDQHMSWENYGSYWHIDHIYPQSLLPYTSMEDENFKKCWSLNNLRPLEKIANIKKGNKVYGFFEF